MSKTSGHQGYRWRNINGIISLLPMLAMQVAEYQQQQAELMRRDAVRSGEDTVSKPLNGCDNGLDLASVPSRAPGFESGGDGSNPPRVIPGVKDRPVIFHKLVDRSAVVHALDLRERQVGRFVLTTVSVRGLYRCLATLKTWLDWFEARVVSLQLIENKDYIVAADGQDIFLDVGRVPGVLVGSHSSAGLVAAKYAKDVTSALVSKGLNETDHVNDVAISDDDVAGIETLVQVDEVDFGGRQELMTDARRLWMALASRRDFPTWFNDRRVVLGLVEGVDYVAKFPRSGEFGTKFPGSGEFAADASVGGVVRPKSYVRTEYNLAARQARPPV